MATRGLPLDSVLALVTAEEPEELSDEEELIGDYD